MVSNSVVEMAVDNQGIVLSARILGRSGLESADTLALRTARALHFAPAASSGSGALPMQWGQFIVDWQTTLPEETNSTDISVLPKP